MLESLSYFNGIQKRRIETEINDEEKMVVLFTDKDDTLCNRVR